MSTVRRAVIGEAHASVVDDPIHPHQEERHPHHRLDRLITFETCHIWNHCHDAVLRAGPEREREPQTNLDILCNNLHYPMFKHYFLQAFIVDPLTKYTTQYNTFHHTSNLHSQRCQVTYRYIVSVSMSENQTFRSGVKFSPDISSMVMSRPPLSFNPVTTGIGVTGTLTGPMPS